MDKWTTLTHYYWSRGRKLQAEIQVGIWLVRRKNLLSDDQFAKDKSRRAADVES